MKIRITRKDTGEIKFVTPDDIFSIEFRAERNITPDHKAYAEPVAMDSQFHFETQEKNKGSPELDVKQPTQKPMSALEHLQKVKELIG